MKTYGDTMGVYKGQIIWVYDACTNINPIGDAMLVKRTNPIRIPCMYKGPVLAA